MLAHCSAEALPPHRCLAGASESRYATVVMEFEKTIPLLSSLRAHRGRQLRRAAVGCARLWGWTPRHQLVSELATRDVGQDVVEYGLLIATIAVIVLIGTTTFGAQTEPWFAQLAGKNHHRRQLSF